MIIGCITYDNDIITNIDVNLVFLNDVKNKLAKCLMMEMGKDELTIRCNKSIVEFYEEFGFYKTSKKFDNNVVMICQI